MALRYEYGDEMMAKLTDAQIKALRILAGTSTKRANMNTVRALYRMTPALAEFRDYPERGLRGIPCITEAGRDYLAALDSTAAAPAQPAGDFGVGNRVVIRKDAKMRNGSYLALMQKARSVGEVVDFDRERVIVEFSGGAADDGHSLLPEQLELWKPAEPGSDAKDDSARDEELASRRRIMNEINNLLYAARGNPGTRVFNQTSMVDDVNALIQENERLGERIEELQNIIVQRNHVIATLRTENADLIIERDTMDADRKRLRDALAEIKETAEYRLEDWIAVQVQYLPGDMVGYRLILNKANESLAEPVE